MLKTNVAVRISPHQESNSPYICSTSKPFCCVPQRFSTTYKSRNHGDFRRVKYLYIMPYTRVTGVGRSDIMQYLPLRIPPQFYGVRGSRKSGRRNKSSICCTAPYNPCNAMKAGCILCNDTRYYITIFYYRNIPPFLYYYIV